MHLLPIYILWICICEWQTVISHLRVLTKAMTLILILLLPILDVTFLAVCRLADFTAHNKTLATLVWPIFPSFECVLWS